MNRTLSAAVFTVCILLVSALEADAQRFNLRNRYGAVGVNLNAMNYWGDIVPQPTIGSFHFRSTRPNIGVNYTYKLYPRISARAELNWGRITGNDAESASREGSNVYRNVRNLSFRNDIKELSFVGMVDLFENRRTYLRRPNFNAYAFAGVSVFHHNPKAYWDQGQDLETGWYALQPLGTEGQNIGNGYPTPYSRIQIAIPFGLGVTYRIDRLWNISFELGIRKTFTDYLDDVSTNYAAKADLMADPDSGLPAALLSDRSAWSNPPGNLFPIQTEVIGGRTFSNANGFGRVRGNLADQRGDPSDNDWFFTTGIQVSYILRPNTRSPKFR